MATLNDMILTDIIGTLESLTSLEREILSHRLEVPDAIWESVYADDCPDELCDEVDTICAAIVCGRLQSLRDHDPAAILLILEDAIEAMTYCADLEEYVGNGEITRQKAVAICKAGERLAAKISQLAGKPVRPTDPGVY